MLDEKILELARKTAGPQLKDLEPRLALNVEALRRRHHGEGALFLYLIGLYQQEVRQRARIVWQNLHRAHVAVDAPLTDSLRADLEEAFRQDLDAEMQKLRPGFDRAMVGAPKLTKEPDWVTQFTAARDHELERHSGEIDHYVTTLETGKARGAAPGASYNFYGTVGAVMTGANSTANVVQHIGPGEREQLQQALQAVKQAITEAAELPDRQRTELGEIADEAAAEVEKESPNAHRLMFTLQTLAAAVQGIAAAPGAYQALRSAAAVIGIQL
ncbi:MAG TPA: hypothetical protein VEG60_10560 [Candidatus Binatia bacterium]|nr:hypothetical protein [Candidatus Binatia bacterium]